MTSKNKLECNIKKMVDFYFEDEMKIDNLRVIKICFCLYDEVNDLEGNKKVNRFKILINSLKLKLNEFVEYELKINECLKDLNNDKETLEKARNINLKKQSKIKDAINYYLGPFVLFIKIRGRDRLL